MRQLLLQSTDIHSTPPPTPSRKYISTALLQSTLTKLSPSIKPPHFCRGPEPSCVDPPHPYHPLPKQFHDQQYLPTPLLHLLGNSPQLSPPCNPLSSTSLPSTHSSPQNPAPSNTPHYPAFPPSPIPPVLNSPPSCPLLGTSFISTVFNFFPTYLSSCLLEHTPHQSGKGANAGSLFREIPNRQLLGALSRPKRQYHPDIVSSVRCRGLSDCC